MRDTEIEFGNTVVLKAASERFRLTPLVCVALLTLSTLLLASPAFGDSKDRQQLQRYATDLEALLNELDAHYPFFELKGIDKEWPRFKKSLLQGLRRCDSDAEFIERVVDVVKFIRDGHATLTDIRPKLNPPPVESFSGVSLLPASRGRVVVMSTAAHLTRVLPPGTVIVKIHGKPARRVMDALGERAWKQGGFFSSPQRATFFAYRWAFRGERGAKTTLHYLQGAQLKKIDIVNNLEVKGWEHNYNMPEGMIAGAKSVGFKRLESGVGYVYLRRIDETVESGIQRAQQEVLQPKGWIVDLRGNTGGGYDNSLKELAARFDKPVAVIIDAGAISAAETFTRDLVRLCNARTFGATSAGSSSKKKQYQLPSGIATLRYSIESRSGINRPIEFHGITPDVPLEAEPEQLAAGLNTEIVAAEKWILEGGKR